MESPFSPHLGHQLAQPLLGCGPKFCLRNESHLDPLSIPGTPQLRRKMVFGSVDASMAALEHGQWHSTETSLQKPRNHSRTLQELSCDLAIGSHLHEDAGSLHIFSAAARGQRRPTPSRPAPSYGKLMPVPQPIVGGRKARCEEQKRQRDVRWGPSIGS
eukprot:gnl/MRDRNA2_/MRDRNA2_63655_c0_seq1.p1 gnl/MRDRNA2_/MRDRNA2_63655_c0~~gnl/MRDRNA2_/MRDRNA2_63655_c0_seq1.p1  ORF type:complete len:159 (+),score=21.17 gnl/MRDRNA2_/MRDRNA2_63655_c0_seq1:102-578(+)